MTGRWIFPLDPACPEVVHAFQIEVEPGVWIDDPMARPVIGDLWESFERLHPQTCERCREFGIDNVDVAYE